jgi:hypothetical protein
MITCCDTSHKIGSGQEIQLQGVTFSATMQFRKKLQACARGVCVTVTLCLAVSLKMKLTCSRSFAADGANVRAVAVAKHLHAMPVAFRYDDVPRAIKRYAPGSVELAGACSLAAKAAQVRPVAVPQHLNAMVEAIGHHQVALAIKRNASERIRKVPITFAVAADGAHEACACS